MNWDDIEEVVVTSHQQPSQTDIIDDKLAIWKPQVISALINNSFLNPLHGKLATNAETMTSSHSLCFSTHTTKLTMKLKK